MAALFSFELLAVDRISAARLGRFHTPHGPVDMPAFMPVGTQATVKGLSVDMLRATGARWYWPTPIIWRFGPAHEVVAALGGLHRFMGFDGPILTDSGGFQIFSLAQNAVITEEQATFRSHLDGARFELSPERSVAIQEALGADVAMVLDHVVALPSAGERVREATERSVRWARRSLAAHKRSDQALFAIVQGGLDDELRVACTGSSSSSTSPATPWAG